MPCEGDYSADELKGRRIKNATLENEGRMGGIREVGEQISKSEMERLRLEWQQKYEGAVIKTSILANEEKSIPQMTPKELDKEIGKCVHRIGILSHELKKRVGK